MILKTRMELLNRPFGLYAIHLVTRIHIYTYILNRNFIKGLDELGNFAVSTPKKIISDV